MVEWMPRMGGHWRGMEGLWWCARGRRERRVRMGAPVHDAMDSGGPRFGGLVLGAHTIRHSKTDCSEKLLCLCPRNRCKGPLDVLLVDKSAIGNSFRCLWILPRTKVPGDGIRNSERG